MVKKEKTKDETAEEIIFIIFMAAISILTLGGAFAVWWMAKMAIYYGVKAAQK